MQHLMPLHLLHPIHSLTANRVTRMCILKFYIAASVTQIFILSAMNGVAQIILSCRDMKLLGASNLLAKKSRVSKSEKPLALAAWSDPAVSAATAKSHWNNIATGVVYQPTMASCQMAPRPKAVIQTISSWMRNLFYISQTIFHQQKQRHYSVPALPHGHRFATGKLASHIQLAWSVSADRSYGSAVCPLIWRTHHCPDHIARQESRCASHGRQWCGYFKKSGWNEKICRQTRLHYWYCFSTARCARFFVIAQNQWHTLHGRRIAWTACHSISHPRFWQKKSQRVAGLVGSRKHRKCSITAANINYL